MSDERAQRMAGRFGGSDEDEPEDDSEAEQSAEPEAPQEAPSEAPQGDEPEPEPLNVTDHEVIQIYDTGQLRGEIEDLFRDLEYVHERALDQDFGKHTDFYPALLRAGLNSIYEELDIDEDETPRL